MSDGAFFAPLHRRPEWLVYPRAYCRLVEQGLIHITPWHLLEGLEAVDWADRLKGRYPSRDLFPFAYLQHTDDVACWERGHGEKVFVIHDFASPGWENEGEFPDVWSWFRSAVDWTIAWNHRDPET